MMDGIVDDGNRVMVALMIANQICRHTYSVSGEMD